MMQNVNFSSLRNLASNELFSMNTRIGYNDKKRKGKKDIGGTP